MVKIALDAGHGLYTSGKQTPDGIKEWSLNDKVRDKVVDMLADYDVEIMFTDNNEGKTDESLSSRLSAYTKAKVAAFVSIHHNAYSGKWNNATGVEVYTDYNYTTSDLRLADCIYGRLVKYTGLKGRGIKHLNFYVINQNAIPAVLVEGGFMDGKSDYKFITSDAGQTAYAKAVAEGLVEFLGLKKKAAETKIYYRVQTGCFRNKEYADALYAKVKAAGFTPYMVKSGGYYRVQVGAYVKESNANAMAKKLKEAGFDTHLVTDGSGTQMSASTLKSIDVIAKEVLDGKWGNGSDRKKRLTKAGYDYKAVQKRVNELL